MSLWNIPETLRHAETFTNVHMSVAYDYLHRRAFAGVLKMPTYDQLLDTLRCAYMKLTRKTPTSDLVPVCGRFGLGADAGRTVIHTRRVEDEPVTFVQVELSVEQIRNREDLLHFLLHEMCHVAVHYLHAGEHDSAGHGEAFWEVAAFVQMQMPGAVVQQHHTLQDVSYYLYVANTRDVSGQLERRDAPTLATMPDGTMTVAWPLNAQPFLIVGDPLVYLTALGYSFEQFVQEMTERQCIPATTLERLGMKPNGYAFREPETFDGGGGVTILFSSLQRRNVCDSQRVQILPRRL